MTNEELMAFVKKNPISVGCGVVSLALLASLYFRSDLKTNAETLLAEKSAEGERLASNIRHSDGLDEDLARVTAANKEIDSRLVKISELGNNSQFFYRLEGETGVKLIDFRQLTHTPGKAKGAFTPVGFSVSAEGDMRQLLHFLRLLESGTHYCRVLTASITNRGPAARNPALTISLNLELLGAP